MKIKITKIVETEVEFTKKDVIALLAEYLKNPDKFSPYKYETAWNGLKIWIDLLIDGRYCIEVCKANSFSPEGNLIAKSYIEVNITEYDYQEK